MSLLANPSQIILRQQQLLADDILLVCPRPDELSRQICSDFPATKVRVLSWDYGSYCQHRQYAEASFTIEPPTSWQPLHVILFMPKSAALLPLMFAALSKVRSTVSKLWLVGEKREGIESAAKKLATKAVNFHPKTPGALTDANQRPRKLDAARHCQLWEIPVAAIVDDQPENYWQEFSWSVPHVGSISLQCLPGVFSYGRLDAGTEFLLANLPPLAGARGSKLTRLLDFGCGCGVIGLTLHRLYPRVRVEMLDISLVAVESARRSAGNASPELSIVPSTGLSAVDQGLSAIVTNPPFHQGIQQDTRTTLQFLQDCSSYLLPGGSLTLVANRFLPYGEWLDKYVGRPEIIAENSRFKVYHVIRK